MKLSLRTLIFISLALVATATAWLLARFTPEQRLVNAGLTQMVSAFSPAHSYAATIEVRRADGLPKELMGARMELHVSAPNRLHAATTIKGERVEIGRDGQQVWAWEPNKKFAVLGSAEVPRFATRKSSCEPVTLGPMLLPDLGWQMALFVRSSTVERLADEVVAGENCHTMRLKPHGMMGLGDVQITLWLSRGDKLPRKVEFVSAKKYHVELVMSDVTLDAAVSDSIWRLPKDAEPYVQRVALAHLARFFDTVPDLINKPRVKPLGAASGKRELVATQGAGRLERHDDTLVLFLKGTPEQMGAQHGALLRTQVHDVVNRLLYGVGVGSSLAKGEWFFGTIERCQQRIARFVDPRHLREMDALAQAAGLDAEEVRLANFFPELFHCSGFALHGSATRDGHLYHGRILDYMVGVGLERNAVVIVSQPDEAHAWVNVSYAGFTGSVTAMNDAKISIGEMGGRGEGHWDGKPMAQLVREVMEKADSLDEAVEIMRNSPRTCEYYYVIADGETMQSVGIKATPDLFEVVHPGEVHAQLPTPVPDAVLLSAGDRYKELVRRVKQGHGKFDMESARALMTRPVCMKSNIHSVLFQTDTLDFWVANADSEHPAAHARYTHYNLAALLNQQPRVP